MVDLAIAQLQGRQTGVCQNIGRHQRADTTTADRRAATSRARLSDQNRDDRNADRCREVHGESFDRTPSIW
jgi:hypothetical protein